MSLTEGPEVRDKKEWPEGLPTGQLWPCLLSFHHLDLLLSGAGVTQTQATGSPQP